MPPPCDGCQVAPSSSVQQVSESTPDSWDSNVRPVSWSVNRIGSRLVVLPSGQPSVAFADTSAQLAVAGEAESSKVALNVDSPDWNRVAPLLKFVPIDGSPASLEPSKEEG